MLLSQVKGTQDDLTLGAPQILLRHPSDETVLAVASADDAWTWVEGLRRAFERIRLKRCTL